jgi:hypothetical protein
MSLLDKIHVIVARVGCFVRTVTRCGSYRLLKYTTREVLGPVSASTVVQVQ